MIYLILSILCSSMLSIVMRASDGRVKSYMGMIAMNYLTCILMCACFMGFGNVLPAVDGSGKMLAMGLINGVFYMASLVCMQYNILKNGVVLPSLFSKMGALLVPLLASIFMFGELPSIFQWIGFALAMAAIFLMNRRSGNAGANSKGFLMLLLIVEGLASVMAKVYKEWGTEVLSDNFLFFTFGFALVLCLAYLIFMREKLGWKEVLYGALIGIPNFMSARFVLMALKSVPAIIVYPARSIGSIVVVTLVGVLAFREKLNRRQLIAMAVILASLVLLNI